MEGSLSHMESTGIVAPLSSLQTPRSSVFEPSDDFHPPKSPIPVRQSPPPAPAVTPVKRAPSPTPGPARTARKSFAPFTLGSSIRSRERRRGRKCSMAERRVRAREEKNRLYEQRTEVMRQVMKMKNDLLAQWLARSN